MRVRPGSLRAPLSEEQHRRRPPSVHPVFLTHPITGRTVLYCNPGYAIRINELDEAESDRMLAMLFAHQLRPKYQHVHRWTEGDVLVWDHIGTLHKRSPTTGGRAPAHEALSGDGRSDLRTAFVREALSAVSSPAGTHQ